MLHTRTEIEYRAGTASAILPIAGVDKRADESRERRSRLAAEQAVDQVLADSFPASDPPSWTPGIVRPDPSVREPLDHAQTFDARTAVGAIDIIDVSRPHAERTFLQTLISWAGAAVIALIVPVVILLIGVPFALAIRGFLEVIAWAFRS